MSEMDRSARQIARRIVAAEQAKCHGVMNGCIRNIRAGDGAEAGGSLVDAIEQALRDARGDETWQPIASAPRDTFKICGPDLILGHCEKKWIRFGKWYVQERCWYYSGTNERSQYAQVRGDEPTHWMPLPSPPRAALGEKS